MNKKCIYCKDYGCIKCMSITTPSSRMNVIIQLILYSFIIVLSLITIDKCFGANIDTRLKTIIPDNCKINITSGFRSKEKNDSIGGAKNSYHLTDRARDFKTIPRRCRLKIIQNALSSGLTVILYKTHLHIDNRSNQKCLIKTNKGFRYCDSIKYSSKGDI